MLLIRPFFPLLIIGILTISCGSDDDDKGMLTPTTPPLTDSLVELGVKYGSEDRQFLDIYKPASDCPTPIYFDAHGNGGNTSLPTSLIANLNAQGITVIAWESLTSVNTQAEVETGWSDAELMFDWVIDHASAYNFDTANWIIGGSSRGSILSWRYGHRPNPNIKGLYLYNALPNTVWNDPNWWIPTADVTTTSPPIYLVYKREPGSSTDPVDPDFHDPNNGITIVNRYDTLGISDRATLVHSIGTSGNSDRYQFLVDFAVNHLDSCP